MNSKEDILISRMPDPIGRACLSPDLPYPYIVAVDVTIFKLNKQMAEPRYIVYSLNNPKLLKEIDKYALGATRKRISRKNLEQIEIPLPPLPTQRRIVSILEKAEKTKNLRAQADELMDRLLQSLFMEMFGDLGFNAKGWDKKALGDCLEIPLNSGWPPICTDEVGGFPVLSLANLRDNGLSNIITKYYQGDKPSKGFDLEKGDILISRSNTRELVGRAGMFKGVPDKVIYPDLLIRIRLNRTILNPVFFEKYLAPVFTRAQ